MKIERVNVEMILEWLERYANIFKEPISKCVNNYEAGAWEALEQMKERFGERQDLLEGYEGENNIFTASYVVTLTDLTKSKAVQD